MCERARGSRDGSSRYSIDTLFPGLSNNSAHTRSSGHSSPQGLGVGGLESIHSRTTNKRKLKNPVHCEKNDEDVSSNISLISGDPTDSLSPKKRMEEDAKIVVNDDAVIQIKSSPSTRTGSNKSISEGQQGGSNKRKASPLKPASQPKQMYPSTPDPKILNMRETFEFWVQNTYGDSAKTKTITKKKYNRIVKTLLGQEINNAETSKFRFWSKSKGKLFKVTFSLGSRGRNFILSQCMSFVLCFHPYIILCLMVIYY